jgi:hypothetical protein
MMMCVIMSEQLKISIIARNTMSGIPLKAINAYKFSPTFTYNVTERESEMKVILSLNSVVEARRRGEKSLITA